MGSRYLHCRKCGKRYNVSAGKFYKDPYICPECDKGGQALLNNYDHPECIKCKKAMYVGYSAKIIDGARIPLRNHVCKSEKCNRKEN